MSIHLNNFEMNEIDETNLTDQKKSRLKERSNIENYFNQRKLCSTKISQYVAAFHSIGRVLIVLSSTSGGVCIISSVDVVGTPVGIVGASFSLIFSLTTGITKKLLSIKRKKKKKHDKILKLAKSKLDSFETLASQTLIEMEISHEEFITILKEKDKYEKMKENVTNINQKQKL